VQHWPAYTPGEKRSVWRRITMDNSAWRFNRYAERARLATGADHPPAEGLVPPAEALVPPAEIFAPPSVRNPP
jgi:uncharacterized protein